MASVLNQFFATVDDPRFQSLKQQTGAEDDIILAALDMQNEEDAMPRDLDYSRESGLRQVVAGAPMERSTAAEPAGPDFSDMSDVFAAMGATGKTPGAAVQRAPQSDGDMADVFAAMDRVIPAQSKKGRTWGQAIKDTGAQVMEGAVNIAKAPIDLVAPESDAAAAMETSRKYWYDAQSTQLRDKIAQADARVKGAILPDLKRRLDSIPSIA